MKRPPTGNIKSKLPENKWEFLKKMLMKCFHWTPKQVPIIHVNSEWRWKVWNFLQLGRWEGAVTKQAWCFVLVWFGLVFFFFSKNTWTHQKHKTLQAERPITALLLSVFTALAFSLHIFILKCGYISKPLWRHNSPQKTHSPVMSKMLFDEEAFWLTKISNEK